MKISSITLFFSKIMMVCCLCFFFANHAFSADGKTLAAVKQRDAVLCGVTPGRHGLSAPDSKGTWIGLDVDFCKAVAAAVLGDANKVKFIPTSGVGRFPALQSGEVDLLSRATTVTLSRDASLGFNFGPPTFYTGTGFMLRKELGLNKVEQLDGASICILPGSATEKNVSTLFQVLNITFRPVVIGNTKELISAYMANRCDVLAMDQVSLKGQQAFAAEKPDDHIVLDGIYSKEPLAIAVRQGDDQWYDIIKWVTYATFNAEEMSVDRLNVDDHLSSNNPNIRLLLGVSGKLGEKLGLDNKWAYNIIKQIGNYAEIYDRNFGRNSPLNLQRGVNSLWTDGGLIYGLPIR